MCDASPPPNDSPAMLDKGDVAKELHCSKRHVDRLRAAGRIPKPAQLGRLVRWPKVTINNWIAAGCPSVAAVPETEDTP